jgi:hypothetical protein
MENVEEIDLGLAGVPARKEPKEFKGNITKYGEYSTELQT